MNVFKTSVSIDQDLLTQIYIRDKAVSSIINRDLERLYTLYSRALLQISLTVPEASLLVDVLNNTSHDANSVALFGAEIQDGIKIYRLDRKWGIDGETFIKKINGLSEIEKMALVDAGERFWLTEDQKDFEEWIIECFLIQESEEEKWQRISKKKLVLLTNAPTPFFVKEIGKTYYVLHEIKFRDGIHYFLYAKDELVVKASDCTTIKEAGEEVSQEEIEKRIKSAQDISEERWLEELGP